MLLSGIGVPSTRRAPMIEGALNGLYSSGELGDYWNLSSINRIYTDASALNKVVAQGDPIGASVGIRGSVNITQGTTSIKPSWDDTGQYGNIKGAFSIDRYVLRRLECVIAGIGAGDFTLAYHFHGVRSIFDNSCNLCMYADASNYVGLHHGASQDGETIRAISGGSLLTSGKAFNYSGGYIVTGILARDATANTLTLRGRTTVGAYLGQQQITQAGANYGDNISFSANPNFGQGLYGSLVGGFVINRLLTNDEETLVMDTLEGFAE